MTDDVRLERLDEPSIDGIREKLVSLYAETHQDLAGNVFYTTERFADFLVKQRAHPGFEFVGAWVGARLVGAAFGFSRPSDDEFAFCELMVAPDLQRRGLARRLHDELLRLRPESRAALFVRKDNASAQAAYRKWGWTKVRDVQPTPEAPNFDELVLALPLPTPAP